MLDKITFAKRYSKALFDLSKGDQTLDTVNSDLLRLKTVLQQTPELIQALNNVSFPKTEKDKLVKPLVSNVSSKYVQNLLQIIYACGRMNNLIELVNQFEKLYDYDRKIARAEVVTAVKLNDQQMNRLKTAIAKRTGAKKVILEPKVDQGIIGGVIVKSSNVIFDGSVKTRIDNVRQLLLN